MDYKIIFLCKTNKFFVYWFEHSKSQAINLLKREVQLSLQSSLSSPCAVGVIKYFYFIYYQLKHLSCTVLASHSFSASIYLWPA